MKRQFSPCHSMCGTIIRCCMLLIQLGMQSDNYQAIRFSFLRFVRKVAFARVSSVIVKNHDGGSSLVALLLALMCMSGCVDALSFELDLPVLVLGLDALTLLWHMLERCPLIEHYSHRALYAGQCVFLGLSVLGPCMLLPHPGQGFCFFTVWDFCL